MTLKRRFLRRSLPLCDPAAPKIPPELPQYAHHDLDWAGLALAADRQIELVI